MRLTRRVRKSRRTSHVFLLGAFGDLHCAALDSGKVLWKQHLIKDYGAKCPKWGMTATPLIVDDKLIVNPGAEKASLVALDRASGSAYIHFPVGLGLVK